MRIRAGSFVFWTESGLLFHTVSSLGDELLPSYGSVTNTQTQDGNQSLYPARGKKALSLFQKYSTEGLWLYLKI